MKKIGIDISVLCDAQKTGIGVYCYELVKALLNTNKSDKFILFGFSTFQTNKVLKNLEFKNYPNVEMKIYKIPAKFFRTAFLLWQKLNWPPIEKFTGPVDIFHSFNWYMPPQNKGKKVATVFDLTSQIFPDWHDPRTSQLDKVRLERIVRGADLTITISQSAKDDFLKLNPKGPVEVVYPAANNLYNLQVDKDKTEEILKKYQLKRGYVLSVSTLEPRKNLKSLIEAYLKSQILAPLVLVGKMGWRNSDLFELINQNMERIKVLGFVPTDDLKILYQQALCLIYPSFYEGFGIPVLEAMASGTPVITSNTSSLPEVGGDAVLYIDPYDIESIRDSLNKIGNNPDLRKKLITEGFKQSRNFEWKKSAQELNTFYQELLSQD